MRNIVGSPGKHLYQEYFRTLLRLIVKNFAYLSKYGAFFNILEPKELANNLEIVLLKTQKECMNGMKRLIEGYKRERRSEINSQSQGFDGEDDAELRTSVAYLLEKLNEVFLQDII